MTIGTQGEDAAMTIDLSTIDLQKGGHAEGSMVVCPDCNGNGFVEYMDTGPDVGDHRYECKRCVEGEGMVPA